MPSQSDPQRLSLVAVLLTDETTRRLQRAMALSPVEDELVVHHSAEGALEYCQLAAPDLLIVEATATGQGLLALCHHACALAPGVELLLLAAPDQLELATRAAGLAASRVLLLPLDGDDLQTALGRVREDRARRIMLAVSERPRPLDLVAEAAELALAETRREAGTALVRTVEQSARSAVLYLNSAELSRQLMLVASSPHAPAAPSFAVELEVERFAREVGLEVVSLAIPNERVGLLLVEAPDGDALEQLRDPSFGTVCASILAMLGARESSLRGAMKDPDTGAYTFGYFVDVAARELDRAKRHARAFSVATLSLLDAPALPAVWVAEQLFGAVRESDVISRVEDGEFFLLLPETDGLGAHRFRHRIQASVRATELSNSFVCTGVASFPHDGRDLSQLLRVATRRAQAGRTSPTRLLPRTPTTARELFHSLQAHLLRTESFAPSQLAELHLEQLDLLRLVRVLMEEARRGGACEMVTTQPTGLSLGTMVRSTLTAESEQEQAKLREVAPVEHLEALVLLAEQGAYAIFGEWHETTFHAFHTSDHDLVDLLVSLLDRGSEG